MKPGAELKFVCLCTCVQPDVKTCKKIAWAADSGLDWDLVYDIALAQKVYPLLYQALNKIVPDKVPGWILNKLKQNYIANAARNIQLSCFLTHILTFLETNGIIAVPFKGPVLAQEIYGSIDLRQFADLDILVCEKDSLKAWEILIDQGFQPELNLTPGQRAKYIKTEDNISFFKNRISVELHWEITGLYLSKPLTLEKIKDRLIRTKIYNTYVLSLSVEDLLVYLCIHGAKHGWESLEQICCVAEILKNKTPVNWHLVEKLALKWRCRKMLYLGLKLASSLLHAPVPLVIMDKININRQIKNMCDSVYSSLKDDLISNRASFFHMKIRDSFSDQLRYCLRIIFCPTVKDWLYFPLPPVLSFIHYGLRPLRLITQ